MIISLRKLNNKSDLFEPLRAPGLFGHLSNLKFLICDGHWEAMGRLWEAIYVVFAASYGNYLCIVLGYKLAMDWLWGGYGEAMGRLWEAMYVLM